ncbi:cobaltochelatase subunit CobN [Dialister sp.]|uniref:cobaltochelatase subunit CobN n=1 Tax=Dialister sp. TaxID=1955814 RepID=UPI003F0BF73F
MKLIYMTNVDRRYFMMNRAMESLQREGKLSEECRTIKTADGDRFDTYVPVLQGASLVMIKFMGNSIRTKFWQQCLSYLERQRIPYYMDAAGSAEEECRKWIKDEDIEVIKKYCFYGGMENYRNVWLYGAGLFDASMEKPKAPSPLCWAGLYHPHMQKGYMTDLNDYLRIFCIPGRPTLGFLFYRDEWVWGDTKYQDAFIREAEKQGLNVIPVFTNGLPDTKLGMPSLDDVFRHYFIKEGKVVIDGLVNVMKFSFTTSGSISRETIHELGVPVLQCYSLLMPEEEWRKSQEGMNAMEVSISIAMPEFDGVIHGVPIAAKHVKETGEVEYLPVEERISAMAAKAGAWARLHRKANKDKKIAIIFHNYPPKNSNIGSAFGLDSIESVRCLLGRMKEEGYRVDHVPEDGRELIRMITHEATNDISLLTEEQEKSCHKVTERQYKNFFSTFPEDVKKQMEKDWGKAPGTVMVDEEGNILVPGVLDGHVFITVQAPRGYGFDADKIYHDPYIAPTHQYLAYYQWIRDIWKADAVIHVGTHGNLEWLPGKGAGLDRSSYPDLALGSLPNVYPYHMTITGEGIQAKRRGSACLVDHMPAPMTDAGTYDELEELDKAMDEYAHFLKTEPETAERLTAVIRKLASKANLDGEVSYDEKEPFSSYLGRLHSYIEDLKNSECHAGLHVLGRMPEGDILVDEILQLMRQPNEDIPSIFELFSEKRGHQVKELMEKAQVLLPENLTGSEMMAQIRQEARQFVQGLKEDQFRDEGIQKVLSWGFMQEGSRAWRKEAEETAQYICHDLYKRLSGTENEMRHILEGTAGKYIMPGPSGSPHAGGVSLLPAGINFYGIDPRRLPTKTAWEVGKKLGDEVIAQYIREEGKYPENIGMVFWSGANMRSHGQCIAEFLYLMGIRPLWEKGSLYVKHLEVIPLTELKRPRLDVTGRISGLFRDTMPAVVSLMDKAVLLAASLPEKEEDNFVRKHALHDSHAMEEKGMEAHEAWREACYRIFGDAPGTYGAGVSALLESKKWDSLNDLSRVFVRWGGHAYGSSAKGDYKPELFKERLSHMDVTIKNEDNHETNMMSSDDYNAYHGGMIAAVRSLSGKQPHSYEGDSTDRGEIKVRSVQEQAKRIFRMETVNPKFIHGMMQHGYKGAADLSSRAAISFQWDATSRVMEDWMYEKLAQAYALDPVVQDWMKEVNPWALQRITETLLEAEKRGLWKAADETMDQLESLYLDIEGELEEENQADS